MLLRECMAEPIGNDLPRTNHEATLLARTIRDRTQQRPKRLQRALGEMFGDRNDGTGRHSDDRTIGGRPRCLSVSGGHECATDTTTWDEQRRRRSPAHVAPSA